eukprot:2544323-Rhodomonas_salina.1
MDVLVDFHQRLCAMEAGSSGQSQNDDAISIGPQAQTTVLRISAPSADLVAAPAPRNEAPRVEASSIGEREDASSLL